MVNRISIKLLNLIKIGYIKFMDVDIKFCKSAFKHGISEADIRQAIDTVKYDEEDN
ncbi:MAG: hypothetical protein FWB86_06555 [Treponema sp.]|nr:hypothetical protein [Treponema sp.]